MYLAAMKQTKNQMKIIGRHQLL